jgi:hypothetical protein
MTGMLANAKRVIDQFPELVLQPHTTSGALPIHAAALRGCGLELGGNLIELYQESACVEVRSIAHSYPFLLAAVRPEERKEITRTTMFIILALIQHITFYNSYRELDFAVV